MKSKARGRPGALKRELPLLKEPTPMHSSAKSPGLPGESRDERLTHIQMGVRGSWSRYKHARARRSRLHRGANKYAVTHIHAAPCSSMSRLPHCSVSQDGSSAVIHSRDSPFPEWVTHTRACKAQLIDLLDFRG